MSTRAWQSPQKMLGAWATRSTAVRKRLAARCNPILSIEDPIDTKVIGLPFVPSEGSSFNARSRRSTARTAPRLWPITRISSCLLYTSDAADDLHCVDLGGRRIIKKKKKKNRK